MSAFSFSIGPVPLQTQTALAANTVALNQSLLKLSTGLRINRGADDPAGLIAAESLSAQLRSLEAESRALERADAVVAVADNALGEVENLLVEAEALAVANANSGGLSDAEKAANQLVLDSIVQSVDRLAGATGFNGDKLLDGAASVTVGEKTIDIDSAAPGDLGATEIDGETYDLADLSAGGPIDIVNGDAAVAQQVIAAAREEVSAQRGALGAFAKNTISSARASNDAAFENVSSAVSIIRDTSFASEVSNLVRFQTLAAANVALFGVAKSNGETVLQLIG